MYPEVEKGILRLPRALGGGGTWVCNLGMWAAIRTWKRSGNLKLGDNFFQIQAPEAIFTLFPKYSKVLNVIRLSHAF